MPTRRWVLYSSKLLLVFLVVSIGLAQNEGSTSEPEVLGLAAVGVSAGFPAFQAYALNASVQYRFVGLATRATWTADAGVYGSLALRGYPPIPGSPVPVFLEAGLGSHSGGAVPFLAAGGHIPLGRRLRLDIEAGAASVPLLDQRQVVPFLSAGVSYAFAFDPSHALSTRRADREAEARERVMARGGDCGLEPDGAKVGRAVAATVSGFLRDARATYGSLYTNLSYSYDIEEIEVNGDRASASISYQGTVTEIATGKTISASGSASARFRWNGCSWSRTGVSY
ncbi:MAG TPA: hypothetical protein VF168_06105 [Trueperaceae bacterium]